MSDHVHDVAVVGVDGADRRLVKTGLGDIAVVSDVDLTDAAFDEVTHTWMLPSCRARVIVTDQIRCGRDDLAPYLGVAVHGAPNYFMVTGARDVAGAKVDYIAQCLGLMRTTGSSRIEVLYSTQRMFCMRGADRADRADAPYWRRMAKAVPTSFDLSSHVGVVDEVYDGPAILRTGEDERQVRVRLSGRVDPIDGRYHWQGTIFGTLPDGTRPQPVTVTIGEKSAPGRITERTQQGGYSVAGVGAPPYALDDVEVVVPLR